MVATVNAAVTRVETAFTSTDWNLTFSGPNPQTDPTENIVVPASNVISGVSLQYLVDRTNNIGAAVNGTDITGSTVTTAVRPSSGWAVTYVELTVTDGTIPTVKRTIEIEIWVSAAAGMDIEQ